MLLLLRSYVCLTVGRQPTLERAYQRDIIKDGDLKVLLEHLDLAILSIGLLSYLNQYIPFLKFSFSWVSVICNQKNPDRCMDLFFISNANPGIICYFVQNKSIHPFHSPSTLSFILGKFFPSVQLCGLNRICHCISSTFSATFNWLRYGFGWLRLWFKPALSSFNFFPEKCWEMICEPLK